VTPGLGCRAEIAALTRRPAGRSLAA
jgi:hypothetical protein